MQLETVSIDKLIPYEKNPRDNSKSIDNVANSIGEFGYNQPIVVDKDYVIVAGHTRYCALKKLGEKEVDVVVLRNLTDEQIKAYRLADNKAGESSEWIKELLDAELSEITNIDMSDFGFTDNEITEIIDYEKERDDLSGEVKSSFEVIIECSDESEQEETFNKLQEEGYKCRVLTL